MAKQNKWAKLNQELKDMKTLSSEVWKRLNAAILLDDPALIFCRFCHRPIGWKGHHFGHGCIEEGCAFGWTDIRKAQEIAISMNEIPGTLWYEGVN